DAKSCHLFTRSRESHREEPFTSRRKFMLVVTATVALAELSLQKKDEGFPILDWPNKGKADAPPRAALIELPRCVVVSRPRHVPYARIPSTTFPGWPSRSVFSCVLCLYTRSSGLKPN